MNIGDLVENQWGDLGIVLRQVGVVDRWIVQWLTGSETQNNNGVRAQWGADLYVLDRSET